MRSRKRGCKSEKKRDIEREREREREREKCRGLVNVKL